MKILKTILYVIALILIFGGLLLFLITVNNNRSAFQIFFADPVVKTPLAILIKLLYCAVAVLLGLIILTVAIRIGLGIRAKERERRKLDAQRRKEEKWEEEKEELLKDIDTEGV